MAPSVLQADRQFADAQPGHGQTASASERADLCHGWRNRAWACLFVPGMEAPIGRSGPFLHEKGLWITIVILIMTKY